MKAIREILRMTQEEFAEKIGVEQATISRNELGKNLPSPQLMERVYQFAFDKKIQINQLKKMLWAENLASDHKLLFHGAKREITGEIDVTMILDVAFTQEKAMISPFHLFLISTNRVFIF
jgi:transcriptional regulator with XRE-family HTH domain